MYRKLGLILMGVSLLSCNGNKGGSSGSNPKNENQITNPETEIQQIELSFFARPSVSLNKDFSNFNEFSKNLNAYAIQVKVKQGSLKSHKLNCQSNETDAETKEANFDFSGKEAELILNLDESTVDAAEYWCSVKGDGFGTTKSFKLKKSLIISHETDVTNLKSSDLSNIDLETLVITERGVLKTLENNVHFKVKNLISQNGKITTILTGSEAPKNTHGLSGGQISIKASDISGDLKIELRGQKGGVQAETPPTKTIIPPTPAHLNGKCGQNDLNGNKRCEGKKGLPGEEGDRGYRGFDGGDTGRLVLQAKNINNLKLQVQYFPGLGSSGGEGGLGGPGGEGGKGNNVRYHERSGPDGCAACLHLAFIPLEEHYIKYPDGAKGDQGPKGRDGDKGQNGIIDESTLILTESDEEIQFSTDWAN